MSLLTVLLVALVAIEHIYILILEMFLWTKPRTRKIFGFSKVEAEKTVVFAANQGLYNGFLAAGLIWGLLHSDIVYGEQIQIFFLSCIIVAAIYGGYSVKRSIILVQGLPAIVALLAVWLI